MPLYFAYGANMDASAMAGRCPRSKPVGPGRLMRHRLAIMREGWLTVERAAAEAVHGVLWDLALSDVAALDRFEATGSGLYSKMTQPVVVGGGPKRALIYVGSNAGPGRGNGEYLASVLRAARGVPLPAEGIAALERLARGADAKRDPAIAPLRPRR